MVTLVGPGGIGKTRLAIETASQCQNDFSDGIYFVPLAPITASLFIVPVITDAIGYTFQGTSALDPKSQLLNHPAYGYAVNKLRDAGSPSTLSKPQARSAFAFLVDQLGWFEFRMGNISEGATLFAESLSLARENHDQEALYYIHGNWSYLPLLSGDIAEAKRLTTESSVNAQAMNSPWHIAIPTNVLGIVDFQEGYLEKPYQQLF